MKTGQIIYIALSQGPEEDEAADLAAHLEVARDIGRHLNGYKVIVNKSNVPGRDCRPDTPGHCRENWPNEAWIMTLTLSPTRNLSNKEPPSMIS